MTNLFLASLCLSVSSHPSMFNLSDSQVSVLAPVGEVLSLHPASLNKAITPGKKSIGIVCLYCFVFGFLSLVGEPLSTTCYHRWACCCSPTPDTKHLWLPFASQSWIPTTALSQTRSPAPFLYFCSCLWRNYFLYLRLSKIFFLFWYSSVITVWLKCVWGTGVCEHDSLCHAWLVVLLSENTGNSPPPFLYTFCCFLFKLHNFIPFYCLVSLARTRTSSTIFNRSTDSRHSHLFLGLNGMHLIYHQ